MGRRPGARGSPASVRYSVDTGDDRPSALRICADQQRDDTLGCSGNVLVETLANHRIDEKSPYFYDPAIRMPWYSSPGVLPTGRETDAAVEFVDFEPTNADPRRLERVVTR